MCEAATIGYAIGAVLAIAGGVQAAETQRAIGRYSAEVAENNAVISEQQARDANLRGARAADEQRLKTRMMIGKQRASLAAQGVTLDSDTSLDILGDTALMGAIDEDTIRMNAAREAWGYSVQATNYRNQGRIDRWGGRMQARGTLLGAAAQAAQMGAGAFGAAGGGSTGASSVGSGFFGSARGGF